MLPGTNKLLRASIDEEKLEKGKVIDFGPRNVSVTFQVQLSDAFRKELIIRGMDVTVLRT